MTRRLLTFTTALLITGCAHSPRESRQPAETTRANSSVLLNTTKPPPGSVYNIKIYVVKKGDSLSAIARRFRKSVSELIALNPDIQPNRLPIGQKIRVAEDKIR